MFKSIKKFFERPLSTEERELGFRFPLNLTFNDMVSIVESCVEQRRNLGVTALEGMSPVFDTHGNMNEWAEDVLWLRDRKKERKEEDKKRELWKKNYPDYDSSGCRNIKLTPYRESIYLDSIPVLTDEDKNELKYILEKNKDRMPLRYKEKNKAVHKISGTSYEKINLPDCFKMEEERYKMKLDAINKLKARRLNINKEEKRKKDFIKWKINKILNKAVEEGKTAWIPTDEMILKDYKPKYT